MLLKLFIVALVVVFVGAVAGALLWRRFYRDDPANAARRVFKNSAVTFVLRVLVRGLDLVFAVVLYSQLAADAIGAYVLAALLVAQYLATFTEFGLGVLLTREVARDRSAAPRLFGATLSLRWLLTAFVALPAALLVVGAYWLLAALGLGEALDPLTQQAIWVLLLTLPFSAYAGAVTALYNAAERMEVPALIELLTALLSFLARLAVILLGFGILGLSWAAVGVTATTALVFFWLQRRDFFAPTLSRDTGMMRQLVPVAFPLMLNNLLSAIFFRFDLFIVRAFGGPQSDRLVASYNMAYQILGIALILPPAITFAVFPLLARRAADDRGALAMAQQRTTQLMLLLAFPLAMGLSLLAPALVALFTLGKAANYPYAAPTLAILAWFLPLSFVNGLLQYVLIALNQQRLITRAFLAGAAFNLVCNLVAVPVATYRFGQPELGLYAASALTIASEVVLLLVFWPTLVREGLRLQLIELAWRPALAALAMGAAMLALLSLLPLWPGGLIAALAAAPVYAGALWALGALGSEEHALVRRILGRAEG